jgi:hypothetical protein
LNDSTDRRRSRTGLAAAPDAALARDPLVRYRYALRLSGASQVEAVVRILEEVGVGMRYLLLASDGARGSYRAWLGLARADVYEFPLRLAAEGVHIEQGEATAERPPRRRATAER